MCFDDFLLRKIAATLGDRQAFPRLQALVSLRSLPSQPHFVRIGTLPLTCTWATSSECGQASSHPPGFSSCEMCLSPSSTPLPVTPPCACVVSACAVAHVYVPSDLANLQEDDEARKGCLPLLASFLCEDGVCALPTPFEQRERGAYIELPGAENVMVARAPGAARSKA